MHGTKMYKISLNLCAWWGQGVYSVLSNKQPTQHLKACFCRTHKLWVGKWKDEWPAVVHVWRLQRDLPWSDHWLHWRLQFCWRPCGHKPLHKENPPETGEGEAGCGSGFWRGRGHGARQKLRSATARSKVAFSYMKRPFDWALILSPQDTVCCWSMLRSCTVGKRFSSQQ